MSLWMQLLASFIATCAFAALVHQPWKAAPISALIGTFSYAIYLAVGQNTVGYFLAALFIGICAEICARFLKRTATLFTSVAIIPLVPGVGLYRTMRYIAEGDYVLAVSTGSATLLGLCAIALAVTITSMLFRALKRKETPC